jgi:Zn-dependent protease
MPTDLIFGLVILVVSVILHEVAHGYMANWLGDPTARLQGRLTLNPISHIDPVGTIIVPALLVFTHSPILIGYAKPVPYNPYNLHGKYDEALVAGAGPGTNILLALFNLRPIPPLDGSKVLSSLLPGALGRAYDSFRASFERLGILSGTLLIMGIFYFLLAPAFGTLLSGLFGALTGVPL